MKHERSTVWPTFVHVKSARLFCCYKSAILLTYCGANCDIVGSVCYKSVLLVGHYEVYCNTVRLLIVTSWHHQLGIVKLLQYHEANFGLEMRRVKKFHCINGLIKVS